MNERSPMISVLMPVYNVKDYIRQSIESVLNQTYEDFELIIINDGSIDESGIIAEEYAQRDGRVKVYHIENAGLANARNMAIQYAIGKYIAFIDSDDFVETEYLELLVKGIVDFDAEIAVCSYSRYVEVEKMYYFPILEEGYQVKVFDSYECYSNYYNPTNGYNISLVVAWAKLIKRTLFENIHFPTGKLHEDSYTTYKLYLKAKKIAYINKSLYTYRIREKSITDSGWSRQRIHDFVEQSEERIALLTTLGLEVTKENIEDHIAILRNCKNIALQNGYIEEYHRLNEKLSIIDQWRNR